MKVMIVQTIGFINDVDEEVRARIFSLAMKHIRPQYPNWVVFYPEGKRPTWIPENAEQYLDDNGRTLIIPDFKGLKEKVYVILDDYGDPEKWDQMYDPETVKRLRKAPNCRYTITFLLADEY